MTRDMTKGPILRELVTFTVPLVLGTLLQLTYNAVDGIMVGRLVGKNALAAVGTTNPLVTLLLLFFNGICLGTGILIGNLYGAKKQDELEMTCSTGFLAGGIFSVFVSVMMSVAAKPVLRLLQVKEEILAEAALYLRIILIGLFFSFLYNYLASMLRAMGDSSSPLLFLGISAVLNIIGDYCFIYLFRMGIVGAAVSTVVCESISDILCLIYIEKRVPELRLKKKWLRFDLAKLKKILSYGIVSALQQSTVQMGKIGTQAIVNTMGVSQTAAFGAVNRFDDYAMIPQQNTAHAMTAVMAQNKGAGKFDRVNEAFRLGMGMEIVYGIVISLFTFLLARPLIGLFSTDPDVIAEGTTYLKLISLMYVVPGISNGAQGFFRGIGDLKVTLYSSLINMGTRVLSEIPMVFVFHMGFEAIPWSYLVGWICMLVYEIPFLVKKRKEVLSGK